MRVIGIVCSPRKEGNTEILVREALGAIQELGGETELITVSGKNITPCDGCRTCVEKGVCRINDDMQEIYQQLLQADGIIMGSPVYFLNVSSQAKAVIDRTFVFWAHGKLKGKVGGAIVVAGRIGTGQALNLLYSYFVTHRMLVAGGAMGYGRDKGVIKGDATVLEDARNLGKAMVSLYQRLSK